MRIAVLMVLVAGCGDDGEPVGPAPWTSGSIVRTQVFKGDGLVALAGRVNTELAFECPVDERKAPAFANCPHEVWMMWRDTGCTVQDIAIDPKGAPLQNYAIAVTDAGVGMFELGEPYAGDIVWRQAGDTACTVPASGPPARVATAIDPSILRLGTEVTRDFDGVRYTSLETDDGYSVITSVEGGEAVIEPSNGRVQARYLVNGPVRMYAGLYDRMRSAPCIAAEVSDGTILCVPPEPAPLQSASPDPANCFTAVAFTTSPATTFRFEPSATRPRISKPLACDQPAMLYTRDFISHGCKPYMQGFTCRQAPDNAFPVLQLATE